MTNLPKIIKATFSRELVGHIASRLGESETGIGKALDGLLPVVLGGVINKAGAGDGQTVYDLSLTAFSATNGKLDSVTAVLGIMGSGLAAHGVLAQGETLLATVFGTSNALIAEAIGHHAGIGTDSVGIVLTLVGALLLALLGQLAVAQNLRPEAFAAELLRLKSAVRGMLPRGLHGLTGHLWLGGIGTPAARTARGRFRLSTGCAKGTAASARPCWYQALLALAGSVFALLVQLN